MSTSASYVVPRLVVLQVLSKVKEPNKNNKEDVEVLSNAYQKNIAINNSGLPKVRIEGKVTMIKRSLKEATVIQDADVLI